MSHADQGDSHLHRLVLFSDAVFAIAITLLAIEIHPPEHWTSIPELMALMAPKLTAYAVSFAVIGIYWVSHRRIFARLARANGWLDTLNFVVLGLVALLPLATELLWERGSGQVYVVYVSLVALIGMAMALLWGYAAFVGKLALPIGKPEAIFVLFRVAILPGLICGLSFFSFIYLWGWAIMALVIAGLMVISRLIRRLSPPAVEA